MSSRLRRAVGGVSLSCLAITLAFAGARAQAVDTGDVSSSSSLQPRAGRPAAPAALPTEPERDPDAAALAKRLPLDPAVRDLRDALPPDVPGTIRQLGLRPTAGARTDLRGRPLTTEEIVNALAH